MVFNSASFALFFIVVYILYLLLQKHLKLQNRLLLIASCIFYGWWDWRFLFLIFFTITVDFYASHAVQKNETTAKRKLFLTLSIVSNLSILCFFKYFNFFMESFERLFNVFGLTVNAPVLNLILPVGISFYTFQSMSYVVDVYRRQIKPADHWLDYAAYVSYFPQLVAGPIERGAHLLPQILKPRKIEPDQFYEGCYLIFWGLFQKMFIADNLARIVDPIFASQGPYNGAVVLLALYAFAFQIFCDFSGYSNIARGLGKLMGFDIMVNFNLPYFSTNPSEFWRRWHISLSSWLKDYVYIPLGGSKKGSLLTCRNLIITMLLGGLWHGAKWNFVFWGAYHALLLILYQIGSTFSNFVPKVRNSFIQGVWRFTKVLFFFHLVCLGWLLFRAASLNQISEMLYSLFYNFKMDSFDLSSACAFIGTISILLIIQCFQFVKKDLMTVIKSPVILRVLFYVICFYLILFMGDRSSEEFIYFQF